MTTKEERTINANSLSQLLRKAVSWSHQGLMILFLDAIRKSGKERKIVRTLEWFNQFSSPLIQCHQHFLATLPKYSINFFLQFIISVHSSEPARMLYFCIAFPHHISQTSFDNYRRLMSFFHIPLFRFSILLHSRTFAYN